MSEEKKQSEPKGQISLLGTASTMGLHMVSGPIVGGGLGWQALYEQFCDKLNFINECFEGLRPMTAVEAAGALRAACQADVAVTVAGDQVQGYCNGFTGQAYCYLRSERRPVTDNESCQITRVCSDYDGYYYLVRIDAPAFSFKLEG